MSHMITSISPVSMLGGAVDFSGELQMTLGSMGSTLPGPGTGRVKKMYT